jgi:hypothetical protein
MANRRPRVEAWIVGEHELPADLPRISALGTYRPGDVIVRSDGRWTVMTRERFDRNYEWIKGK